MNEMCAVVVVMKAMNVQANKRNVRKQANDQNWLAELIRPRSSWVFFFVVFFLTKKTVFSHFVSFGAPLKHFYQSPHIIIIASSICKIIIGLSCYFVA